MAKNKTIQDQVEEKMNDDGKVKLFCALPISNGKRVSLINHTTLVVDRENSLILFPHQGTFVARVRAISHLRQDSHLVSLEPYMGIEKDIEGLAHEIKPVLETTKLFIEIDTTQEVAFAQLRTLAADDVEWDSLSAKDCDKALGMLGYKLGRKLKVNDKREALQQACKLASERFMEAEEA